MSEAPVTLLATRSNLAAVTGSPLGDIGIAADDSHKTSGGYHCGAFDLRSINAVANDDYSIRQPRDRGQYNADLNAGNNWSSAMDYPDDWPNGGRAAWIRFNNILRAQLGAEDPALAVIRGMNFTPDGTTKRRFDCLTGRETSSADTVTWHTHIEWWRDTNGNAAARDAATNRLCQIARAAIANVSLSAIEAQNNLGDDMFLRSPNGSIYLVAGGKVVSLSGAEWSALNPAQTFVNVPQSLIDKLTAPDAPVQATLSPEQFADFKAGVVPIVHDAAQTGAQTGAAAALDGATIHPAAS